MLAFLPPVAFQTPLPPNAWRGDTAFRHDARTTAAEVVAYEQRRGRLLDLSAEFVAILAGLHASALLWITFKRSLAARYGPPARVPLDGLVHIIGEDGEGGYLIFFPDNSTGSQTEQAAMKPPAEATPRELKEAGEWYAANTNSHEPPAPKAEIGGYIVLERPIRSDTSKLAGHYLDRADAVNHARLYPATEEHAREHGQAAWAEVHPVTKGFYDAITQDPRQAERVASVATLYSHAAEIEGGAIIPAAEHEARRSPESKAMSDQPKDVGAERMEPLDADRKADLANRIDILQKEAEAIVTERGASAAGHYQQHRETFDAKQGDLAGRIDTAAPQERGDLADEKEAQGHEYAAFLAERVGTYKQSVGQDGTGLFKEAEVRKDIAAMLRGGSEPERPTDPRTPPAGRAAGTSTLDHAAGGKYDALRQSEADARALTQQRELAASKGEAVAADPAPVPTRASEPEDTDEAKRARSSGASAPDMEANRPVHIRATTEQRPAPDGTTTTASYFYDPNENPQAKEALAELRAARAEPQPQHPDEHRPPLTMDEKFAAREAAAQAETPVDSHGPDPAVIERYNAESTKRQEAELRASHGEATPPEAKSLSMDEKLAAREATARQQSREDSGGRDGDAGPSAPMSRGMF